MHTNTHPGEAGSPIGHSIFRALVGGFARPRALPTLISIRVQPPHRLHRMTTLVVLALLVLISGSAWAAELAAFPSGVPDLSNPDIRAKYRPVQVGNVGGNPDLPLVILVSDAKDTPRAVLVGLDARNGKNTWSLLADPIVLIVLFENPTTITELLVDPGFLRQGTPSGSFERVPHPGLDALPDVLRTMAEVPARTFL